MARKLSEAEDIVKELVEEARQLQISNKEFLKMSGKGTALRKEVERTNKELKKQKDIYDKIEDATSRFVTNIEKSRKVAKDDKLLNQLSLDIKNKTIAVLRDINNINERINRNDIDSKKLKDTILKTQTTLSSLKKEELRQQDLLVRKSDDLYKVVEKISKLRTSSIAQSDLDQIDEYAQKRIKMENLLANAKTASSRKARKKDLLDLDTDYTNALSRIDKATKSATNKNKIQSALKEQLTVSSALNGIKAQEEALHLANEQWREQYKEVEKITEKIGTIGKAVTLLKSTKMGRFFDFDEVSDAMNATARLNGGKRDIAKSGISAFANGSGFKAGLQGLAIEGAIKGFKFMIESMFKADKRVTDLGKSFGIAKDQAQGLYDVFENRLGEFGINMDDLVGSQLKFNDTFGVAVVLSKDMNVTLAKGAKLIELSEEALKGLSENAIVMGENASTYQNTILGTSKIEQMRSGLFLNDKKVLESVLKTSGGIRANFKGDVEMLTKAVTKATELGTSLDQVNKFGESLLDWESSINAELEAELVTGRQINLERARAFALTGDMVGLTDEMVNQMGSIDEFFKMNVIQQQTLAKAFGMSRDEASDALYQKAFMEKLKTIEVGKNITEKEKELISGDEAMRKKYMEIMKKTGISEAERAKLLGEEVTRSLSQMSAQQKFDETMMRVKEKIAQIFGNGQGLDKIADALIVLLRSLGWVDDSVKTTKEAKADALVKSGKATGADAEILKGYSQTTSGYIGILKMLGPLFGSGVSNLIKLVEGQREKSFNSTLDKYTKVNDSLINPSGRVEISTPQGMILPNKNDSIITTTNPNGLLSGGSIDISALVDELKQLRLETRENSKMLANVYRENKDVYMNSSKVTDKIKDGMYKV